jgi:hypothetical protein
LLGVAAWWTFLITTAAPAFEIAQAEDIAVRNHLSTTSVALSKASRCSDVPA